jgi:flagellar biosynthetic protein FliQ
MNELEVIELGRDAILTLLKISAPIMGMALVVGLIIALFQALTSIQEMTLTFVPKILVIFASVMLLLPYMLSTLSGFTVSLFDRMLSLG